MGVIPCQKILGENTNVASGSQALVGVIPYQTKAICACMLDTGSRSFGPLHVRLERRRRGVYVRVIYCNIVFNRVIGCATTLSLLMRSLT